MFLSVFLVSALGIAMQKNKGPYLGVGACQTCHGSNGYLGDQVSAWKKDRHSRAYQTLLEKNDNLLAILQRAQVSQSTDRQCLRCHTTGGRTKNPILEGVGCEACHGPARRYIDFEVHGVKGGYQNALRFGMRHIIGNAGVAIRNRQRLCLSCHRVDRRPCVPQDPKQAKKQELSFEEILHVFVHRLR